VGCTNSILLQNQHIRRRDRVNAPHAFELGWIITDKGGLRRSDIPELNHVLRCMLWNRGDYVRPIELVKQHLGART